METAFSQFWDLVSGAIFLDSEVFRQINLLPDGLTVALIIVLLAGLSQAIGQCIVLFVNRVKPIRFILSLGISSIVFALSYSLWALSIWLTTDFLFDTEVPILLVLRTLGLSYAPQMLGFLIGLPYFGTSIYILLSIWSLLAQIIGLQAFTSLEDWGAFFCVGLGWLVLQVVQRTIGRPILKFSRWLSNSVAGTKLVTDPKAIEQMIMDGNPNVIEMGNEILLEAQKETPQKKRLSLSTFIIIAGVVFLAVILFSPNSQLSISTWFNALNSTLKLAIKVAQFSAVALLISILLTPLESLSWWAGWYGPQPLENSGTLVEQLPTDTPVNHYVMYLDGINQGSYQYLPEVEEFLEELGKALPDQIAIVKGIIPYTVTNRPVSENQLFSFLWRIIDSIVARNPTHPIGFIINIRNVVAVAISADRRYGPIQNQGLAQVIYNSLLNNGYQLGCGIPLTLIGYSGGGQMSLGVVPFLKHTLNVPIQVISIAGVMSSHPGVMIAEELYHLVGQKDSVEKVGAILFAGRWPFMLLSKWNQAKRRGKIRFIDLGPVAHNLEGGPMGSEVLPNGITKLQQTTNIVTGILLENWALTGLDPDLFRKQSNYELFKQAVFNQISYYPVKQTVESELYQPISTWIGRLILPKKSERQQVQGALFEIYHADATHQHRIGQIVNLRWDLRKFDVKTRVKYVTNDVKFIDQARVSEQQGNIHPRRIDGWLNVDPLESLAGARPQDDLIVMLPEPVILQDTGAERPTILIQQEPIQISGRFYAVVTFVKNLGNDLFLVRHYNPKSQQFDGVEEQVYLPAVVLTNKGVVPFLNNDLEQSPVNSSGWYIYGQQNINGQFVVQSLAPKALLSLIPDQVLTGEKETVNYINHDYWDEKRCPKGNISKVLLAPQIATSNSSPQVSNQSLAESIWKEGDRSLLMHVYGGIGGKKGGENTPFGIFFGHFAYGIATVVRDQMTQELRFEIEYRQIYTHNEDGIISGSISFNHYIGDRQWGWLGRRPFADILIKFPPLTEDYDFDGFHFSPLNFVINELDIMTARYRIGDGTGTTFVSAINSCCQDSSQALYLALQRMLAQFQLNPLFLKWLREHPDHEQTQRFIQLSNLVSSLELILTPTGKPREDWRYSTPNLGTFPVETPLKTLGQLWASWRSLLPRLINDQLAMVLLQLGASLMILRASQVGGSDSTIEPIIPTDLWFTVPKLKKFEY